MGRWLPKTEREKRDKKVIELYHQGISFHAIRERFGVNVDDILRKHGIRCDRRRNVK